MEEESPNVAFFSNINPQDGNFCQVLHAYPGFSDLGPG